MSFTVTEPHPTVPVNTYTHSGRGGLGNTFRAPVTTPSAGVPTGLTKVVSAASASSTSSATRFYAGRGGAGNAHPVSQRRSLSLDDEYVHATTVARATTSGHVGRGGAGNFFKKSDATFSFSSSSKKNHSNRKSSDASSASTGSDASSEGGRRRSGFWARFR